MDLFRNDKKKLIKSNNLKLFEFFACFSKWSFLNLFLKKKQLNIDPNRDNLRLQGILKYIKTIEQIWSGFKTIKNIDPNRENLSLFRKFYEY